MPNTPESLLESVMADQHLERTICDARVALALMYAARLLRDARHPACGAFLRETAVEIGRGIPEATAESFEDDDDFGTMRNPTKIGGLWGKRTHRIVVWTPGKDGKS